MSPETINEDRPPSRSILRSNIPRSNIHSSNLKDLAPFPEEIQSSNREIPEALNDLDSALRRLDSIVGEMNVKLTPLMDIEVYEKVLAQDEGALRKEYNSTFAKGLNNRTGTLRALIIFLESISDALQL